MSETTINYKLIIFDIDGTLADRDTSILLPNVAQWFRENYKKCMFALATNQGGVGLRYWMEDGGFGNPEKFPNKDIAMTHIGYVLRALEDAVRDVWHPGPAGLLKSPLEVEEYVCFAYQSKKSGKWGPIPDHAKDDMRWRQDWRKPSPGMLNEAMDYARVMPEQTLMVGDSEDDRGAAKAAGCDFIDADVFFQREDVE